MARKSIGSRIGIYSASNHFRRRTESVLFSGNHGIRPKLIEYQITVSKVSDIAWNDLGFDRLHPTANHPKNVIFFCGKNKQNERVLFGTDITYN